MENMSQISFSGKKTSKASTSTSSVKKKRSIKSKNSKISEEETDISPEEEITLIVTSIRYSIVNSALDIIYEKYLKKQTVFFVSHCSHLAWKALIDWNYQRKDPGGFQMLKTDINAVDIEPETSPKDSWAGKSVPFVVEERDLASSTKERENTTTTTLDTSCLESTISTAASEKSVSFEETRTATVKKAREILKQNFQKKLKRSLEFSQTLLTNQDKSAVEIKKESYELPSPILMSAKKFPPPRVDVKYTISPGVRGLVSRKPPKSKTIRLDRPKNDIESLEAQL